MSEAKLQIGMEFKAEKALYRLVRYLGGGKYSEVWLADVIEGQSSLPVEGKPAEPLSQVVLKFLKDGATPEETGRFWSEAETLRNLQRSEQKLGLWVDGYSLIPALLDRQEGNGVRPFLVENVAPGVPLDELLRERGTLPEEDVLTIVGQFCRALQTLHDTQKTYLDFQPKDIYWNPEMRRILVIDWNLLGGWTPEEQQADLSSAARVLYQALMGVPPPGPGSREPLARPADQWAKLSVGAHQILQKAFHINLQARYTTAEELRTDIERVFGYWDLCKKNREVAVDFVERQTGDGQATNRDREVKIRQAAAMLSIVERFDLPPDLKARVGASKERIGAWMTGRGALELGAKLFDALDASPALQQFEQALNEAWDTRTALEAIRWIQVTQAALAGRFDTERRQRAKAALTDMAQEKFREAATKLTQLGDHAGLRAVIDEARVRDLLREVDGLVRQQCYDQAARPCREMMSHMRKLPAPYAERLTADVGDLQARAEKLEEQARAFEGAKHQREEIERYFSQPAGEAWQKLADEFGQARDHPALVSVALKWAEGYVDKGQYAQARAIAALGLDYTRCGPQRTELWQWWQFADQLDGAKRLLWESKEREGFRAEDFRKAVQDLRSISAPQAVFGRDFASFTECFLVESFKKARARKDLRQAVAIFNLLHTPTSSQQSALDELKDERQDQMELDLEEIERHLAIADGMIKEWTAGKEPLTPSDETRFADLQARGLDLQKAADAARQSYIQRRQEWVSQLWPLIFGESASGTSTPGVLPTADLRLPPADALPLLKPICAACEDLLAASPKDSQTTQWQGWLQKAQTRQRELELEARPRKAQAGSPLKDRWSWIASQKARWLPAAAFVIGAACGAVMVLICVAVIALVGRPTVVSLLSGGTATATATSTLTPTVTVLPPLTPPVTPTTAVPIHPPATPKPQKPTATATFTPVPTIPTTPPPAPPITPSPVPTDTPTNTPVPSPTAPPPSPTPTDTPVPPTPTDTPVPPTASATAVLLPLHLAFPGEGQTFPVMPWQVVVTYTQPVSMTVVLVCHEPLTVPVTLTLGDKPVVMVPNRELVLAEDSPLQQVGDAYTWQRGIDDLKELPDGPYVLRVFPTGGSSDQTSLQWESAFRIKKGQGVKASIRSNVGGVRIRALPADSPASEDRFVDNTPVTVLGHFTYRLPGGAVPEDGNKRSADWCLFEGKDGQRSWTWCQFLRPATDTESLDKLPLLAPELKVEKYP